MPPISDFDLSELSTVVSDICCYSFLYAQKEKLQSGKAIIPIKDFELTTKFYEVNGKIDWFLLFNDLTNKMTEIGFSNEWLDELHDSIDKNYHPSTLQENVNSLRTGLMILGRLAVYQSKLPIDPAAGLNHSKKTISYALLTTYKVYKWDWSSQPNILSMVNKVLVLDKNLGMDKMTLTMFCENFLDYLSNRDLFFKSIINSKLKK
jgi:hypothetical protein